MKPLFVSLLALQLCACSVAHALTPAEVFRKVENKVVTVKLLDGSSAPRRFGSGVVVAQGMIATNCHVVEPINGLRIIVSQGDTIADASVHVADHDIDLCILKTDGIGSSPVEKGSTQDLAIGAHVYAIGAPQGYDLTLSDGVVSGMRNLGGVRYIQTTAPISKGSSGGGLFDSNGRLVGLTTLSNNAGQALNFALPVELVFAVLSSESNNLGASSDDQASWARSDEETQPVVDRWIKLAQTRLTTFFVDSKSLRFADKSVTAWIRRVSPPGSAWIVDGKSIPYFLEYSHITFDCAHTEMVIRNSYIVDEAGTQLAERGHQPRFIVSPTSQYDALFQAVCAPLAE